MFGRLDDQNPEAEATEYPIAVRKVLWKWWSTKRKFRENRARRRYLCRQFVVLARISRVKPRTDDRDGPPIRFECPVMRRRIDATCKAGDDRQPAPGQLSRQTPRRVHAVTRTTSRSNHCQTRLRNRFAPRSAGIEDQRRIVNLPQKGRILLFPQRQQFDTQRVEPLHFGDRPDKYLTAMKFINRLRPDSQLPQCKSRRGEDSRRISELSD